MQYPARYVLCDLCRAVAHLAYRSPEYSNDPTPAMFEHLGLRRWPFVVVPEPSLCNFIADRTQFRDDLEKLLRSLSRQSASSIHPIWSWFGAGKTHTLHYIANRVAELPQHGNGHLRTIYSEFPRNPRSFVDVYKSFAYSLDLQFLADAYLEICTSSEANRLERDLVAASPDVAQALNVLVLGDSTEKQIAMRWFRAEALPITICRRLGVSRRITSSEEASRVLIALIRLFGLSASSQDRAVTRLIWLLDELQRIERLSPRIRDEINTGLHSTFNAIPTGFSMILSFSGRPTATLPAWFSPELKDRIGRTKVMILPPMQVHEALTFVHDVLAQSRSQQSPSIDPLFPFSEPSCTAIIQNIQEHDELKPRAIMQAFNAVLQEADLAIERGTIDVVSPSFAETVLADLVQLE